MAQIAVTVTQIAITVPKVIVISIFPFRFVEVASLDYIYIIPYFWYFVKRFLKKFATFFNEGSNYQLYLSRPTVDLVEKFLCLSHRSLLTYILYHIITHLSTLF
jgi:hypothetical protein